MQVIPVGADAALVEVADPVEAAALALWIRERVEATEVVPAARSVLVDGLRDRAGLAPLVAGWRGPQGSPQGPVVEVPVVYDGPDLAAVAGAWGVPEDEVPARHAAIAWVSTFCGFAPGFAYLAATSGELPEVPRRNSPRARVAPGSVALAGPFTGVYPTASPGGWQVVGRTGVVLWDQDRPQPALLAPGTRVRFRPA